MYTVENLIEDLKKYNLNTKMDYYYRPILTSECRTHLKEKYDFDLVFVIDELNCNITVGELIELLNPLPKDYEMVVDDFGFTFTNVKVLKYKISYETFKDSNILTLDSQ